MAKDLYRALRCFLIEFQDLKTYHASNNYTAMSLLANIPGDGQPWCAHVLHDTRLCQVSRYGNCDSGKFKLDSASRSVAAAGPCLVRPLG
jgi:hypothetical protein